jgi:hypothetical protein
LLFLCADCGPYTVITAGTEEWRFNAYDLPGQPANVAETYGLAPGARVWFFDAGWITDLAPALASENRCSAPRTFGENILICRLTVAGKAGSATDRTITE